MTEIIFNSTVIGYIVSTPWCQHCDHVISKTYQGAVVKSKALKAQTIARLQQEISEIEQAPIIPTYNGPAIELNRKGKASCRI